MADKKFLDSAGLSTVWNQVKILISNYLSNFKSNLDSSATGSGTYVNVTVEMKDGSLQNGVKVNEDALITKLNALSTATSTNSNNISSIKSKTDNITIDGSTFKVTSTGGVYSSDFATSSGSLNNLLSRLTNIEGLLNESSDADAIIDNLNEVIAYFKDVQEGTTGGAIITDVATIKDTITSINNSINSINNKISGLSIAAETHSHSYTPAGTVSSSFTGTAATTEDESHTHSYTPVGSVGNSKPTGDVTLGATYSNGIATITAVFSGKDHNHSFTGTGATITGGSHSHDYKPSGSVSSGFSGTNATITGGSHSHTINGK